MTQESVLKGNPAVRRLLGVGLVDYLGVGLFVAFSAVYFTRIVGLSTGAVGLGLGVAGLVAMGAAVPIGRLGDRWGVRRTLVGLHVVRALGTAGYAVVGEWWGFLAAVAVVTTADQSVAALTQAFVAELASGSDRVRTLAAYRTVANVGISLGAPIGGLAIGLDDTAAFRVVLLINAGAFIGVAALLTTVRSPHASAPAPAAGPRPACDTNGPDPSPEPTPGAPRPAPARGDEDTPDSRPHPGSGPGSAPEPMSTPASASFACGVAEAARGGQGATGPQVHPEPGPDSPPGPVPTRASASIVSGVAGAAARGGQGGPDSGAHPASVPEPMSTPASVSMTTPDSGFESASVPTPAPVSVHIPPPTPAPTL
ncbi:MFS transporter, partial [Streptomyces sp. SID3343]|uniref:MFS transporter n=1 Tax=Streptomyces sp. SID3343 TaxID=2690260 RepID=UPI001369FB5C